MELPNPEVARAEATGPFAPRRGSQNGWGRQPPIRGALRLFDPLGLELRGGAGVLRPLPTKQSEGHTMKTMISAALLVLALPIAAHAQGIIGGVQRGAEEGTAAAGPVGGVVGGVLGGVTGGVAGLLGVDERPRFRQYVVREARPPLTDIKMRSGSGRCCPSRGWSNTRSRLNQVSANTATLS